MKTKILLLSIAILMAIAGCISPKPTLSNLRQNQLGNDSTKLPVIDVRVGIIPYKNHPQQAEKPKLLWELQDSLPHHLLKVVADKTTKAEDVIALMSKPISPKKDNDDTFLSTDYTEYKVRLIFSNIKRYFIDPKFTHENTRMAYLNTYVSIPDTEKRVIFQSIDKMENEFEEVDLGNLSRDKSVTFNAKLTGTGQLGSSVDNTSTSSSENNNGSKTGNEKKVYDENGNVIGVINNAVDIVRSTKDGNTTTTKSGASASATGEIGYENIETLKEARLIKLQRMKAGFSFAPREIVVSQEGRQNGDISNMIFVDATIKYPGSNLTDEKNVYYFKDLFNKENLPLPANDIAFSQRSIKYVKCSGSDTLLLKVKFEGLLRVVENLKKQTGESVLENDDKVTMYKIFKTEAPDIKIDPFLFCRSVFKITAKNATGDDFTLRILWKNNEKVHLLSDDKPEEFLTWLKKQIDKGDSKNLSSSKFEMYFSKLGSDPVYVVKEKMDANDLKKLKQLTDINLNLETE